LKAADIRVSMRQRRTSLHHYHHHHRDGPALVFRGRYLSCLVLTFVLLLGVQIGRLLEFDYRAITTGTSYQSKSDMDFPMYSLRIHKSDPVRVSRGTRKSIEALSESVIAWWSPSREEVHASFVARLGSLEYELETCSDTGWCDVSTGNDRSCSVCRSGNSHECIQGTVFITMAPEENAPMNEDHGTWAYYKKFRELFKSDLVYDRYPLRTVHFRCVFSKAIRVLSHDQFELHYDYGYDSRSPQVLRVGHVPDRGANLIKGKPVVCGRVLFNNVYAKSVAYFVENNLKQGIPVTIMYEVGTSRVRDRDVLDPYLRDGSLVLVDLRDVLQDLYGLRASWVVWNTKAFMQSLTRKDCLDRVSLLRPSWVGFLDLDEYLTADIFTKVRPEVNIMQLFMLAPVDEDDRDDSRFCNAPAEQKIVEGGKVRTGLTKLFVRPNVPYTSIKVHWIDILSHVYNERDLPHVQVIQPEEAFLYHVRCANSGMS